MILQHSHLRTLLFCKKKDSEREQSEQTNFLEGLWLFAPLVKNEPMGRPWDNVLAKRWWARGRHVRQKEPAWHSRLLQVHVAGHSRREVIAGTL